MENNIFQIKDINHIFRDGKPLEVIRDVSMSFAPGSFTAIVGPSGGGKSTLLRIMAGLIKPSAGEIQSHSKRISLVFQNFAIFPWLTAYENVEFGLKMAGMKLSERQSIVKATIEEVGLSGFEHHYPKDLSGGMRQRVGIARALAIKPDLLLMDEPFSSLDTFTAQKLRADLLDIWLKYKMTIVMVTHLIEEAVQLADNVIVLSQRPAHVKSVHHVHLSYPRNLRSHEFFSLVDTITSEIDQ